MSKGQKTGSSNELGAIPKASKVSKTSMVVAQSNVNLSMMNSQPHDLRIKNEIRKVDAAKYYSAVRVDSISTVLKSATRGPVDTVCSNIYYSFNGVPLSNGVYVRDVFSAVSLNDAIANVFEKNDHVFMVLLINIRAMLAAKMMVHPDDHWSTHQHDEKSSFMIRDDTLCGNCSFRWIVSKGTTRRLANCSKSRGSYPLLKLDLSSGVLRAVCKGLTILVLAMNLESPIVPDDDKKVSFVPNFMSSGILRDKLSRCLQDFVQSSSNIFKSVNILDIEQFNCLLMIGSLAEMWRMLCYGVNKISIGGSCTLELPTIFTDKGRDETKWSVHLYQLSTQALKRYTSNANTYHDIPVLRLYVNGRSAVNIPNIYGYLCKYMQGYYASIINDDAKGIKSRLVMQFNKSLQTIKFLNSASIKSCGSNDGLMFIELESSYNESGMLRIFDKFYSFRDASNKIDVDCILTVLGPDLIKVLNLATLKFLENNGVFPTGTSIKLVWCFEYGEFANVLRISPMLMSDKDTDVDVLYEHQTAIDFNPDEVSWADHMTEYFKEKEDELSMVQVDDLELLIRDIENLCTTRQIPNKLDYLNEKLILETAVRNQKSAAFNNRFPTLGSGGNFNAPRAKFDFGVNVHVKSKPNDRSGQTKNRNKYPVGTNSKSRKGSADLSANETSNKNQADTVDEVVLESKQVKEEETQ